MSAQAERQVVAACLGHAKALLQIRDWLAPEHFEDSELAALYRLVCSASPDQIDPVTLGILAEEQGIGWAGHAVIELAGECLSPGSVAAHAELVLESGRRRQLAEIGRRIAAGATSGTQSAEQVATWASSRLGEVCGATGRAGPMPAKHGLQQWHREFLARMEAGSRITGLPTPWADLNETTGGLQPGRLYVIAGRPGMGKSVLGENISTFDGLRGGRPLVFSLEMGASEWHERAIASRGEAPYKYLRAPAGSWDDSDLYLNRVSGVMPRLLAARGEIDETPSLTLAQIEARAERAHMRSALSMVVIDHMHIMGRPRKNDVSELGEISGGLKRLAKRLNVPVIALAQLNRGNTERTDKRPGMSDLRGSGDIEQDADVILLAHRQDYYRTDGEPKDHLLELIVAKQRGGESGHTIRLHERFDQMRADDWNGELPEREPTRPRGKAFGGSRNG